MKKQLDDQLRFDDIKEILKHLCGRYPAPPQNVWIAKDYSIAALVNDLMRIHNLTDEDFKE